MSLRPVGTSEMTSASPSEKEQQKRPVTSRGQTSPSKKKCRALDMSNYEVFDIPNDSGSEDEVNEKTITEQNEDVDFVAIRRITRKLRDYIVVEDDEKQVPVLQIAEWEQEQQIMNENVMDERNVNESGEGSGKARDGGKEEIISTAAAPVDANFSWSKDFSTFTGKMETYLRVPGPHYVSQDPIDVFCKIWDNEFMEMLVRETNRYAWDLISQYLDHDMATKIPEYLGNWIDVTVEELYKYFAILILFSFCYRSAVREYWSTGILGMPEFRSIMPRSRFLLINKFLHFVSNADLLTRGTDRKIEKIAPVVDHCNRKFAEIYTPSQHLSLDESLLLWKGVLSWKQCIRSKAARFGIKSFELCEAKTGYLLQYRIYVGKNVEMHPECFHGFNDHTAKIVLDLIERYLDVGHVLVMDNWYNQLALTRYLKSRRTDVLGTLNRRRNGIPSVIKDLIPNDVDRGATVSRHSGDISLVAWKDVKLVTLISTYHKHVMIPRRRSGQIVLKPAAVEEYNQYMGGVDLKDQKLSMYVMERKRNMKWYMKVFRRLLNTSLLNAYIVYTKNPMHRVLSHRNFRFKIVEGLLSRSMCVTMVPGRGSHLLQPRTHNYSLPTRLRPGNHYPVYTDFISAEAKGRRKQLRCVRCTALNRRVSVTIKCELCQVSLCIGRCWKEYHNVQNLKK